MRNTSNCTLRITKSTPKKPCCSSEKTDKEAALQTLRQRFPCVRPMPRRGGINARLAYDFFRFLKRPRVGCFCGSLVLEGNRYGRSCNCCRGGKNGGGGEQLGQQFHVLLLTVGDSVMFFFWKSSSVCSGLCANSISIRFMGFSLFPSAWCVR